MKSKLFRILGIVTIVSMLAGTLVAVPAMALDQPVVTLSNSTIGVAANYSIVTKVYTALAVAALDEIQITFPAGTNIGGITDAADADVQVAASSGIGTPAFALTPAASTKLGQVLDIIVPADIGVGATIQVVITVVNPATSGSYNLTVSTQTTSGTAIEAVVASTAYTIINPTIPGLPGVVNGYNSAGVLLTQSNSITAVMTVANVVRITVGPGTYDEDVVINSAILTTLESTAGAATTIIRDANLDTVGGTVDIQAIPAAGFTMTGFTIYGRATAAFSLNVAAGLKTTINSSTVKCPGTAGIVTAGGVITTSTLATFNIVTVDVTGSALVGMVANGATSLPYLTSCVFNVDAGGIGMLVNAGYGQVISCNFNGAQGTGIQINAGTPTIDGGNFTGLAPALDINGGTAITLKNAFFDGNGNAVSTIPAIDVFCGGATSFNAFNNIFKNSPYFIAIFDGAGASNNRFLFNDVAQANGNAKGFKQLGAALVILTHNWWGAATVPSGYNDASISSTEAGYPVGAPPVGSNIDTAAPFSWTAASASGYSAAYFSAKVGYITLPSLTTATITMAGGGGFDTNPATKAPVTPMTVKRYYDFFVSGTVGAGDVAVVKFYNSAVTSNAQVFYWDAAYARWDVCDNGIVNVDSTEGLFVQVTLSATSKPKLADCVGSYFCLVDGVTLPGGDINMLPKPGTQDVSVSPSFSWTAVPGAIGYDFLIADSADIAVPTVADTTHSNGYIVTEPLAYSTQYWWRVTPYNAAGVRGTPIEGTFKTMAEPVEPTEEPIITPTIIITQPPQPPPTVIVPTQEPVSVIPQYLIWIVIAVGAILVIVVIVLIVRTRRIG
jgi:hypothetical protein